MANSKAKSKGGRPTKYNPKYHLPWARGLARRGLTMEDIAKEMQIATSTLYKWMENEEFSEAVNEGRSYSDCMVEESLFKRAIGGTYKEKRAEAIPGKNGEPSIRKQINIEKDVPPDTAACIFWLKNRNPELWRDKREYVPSIEGFEFEDELSKSLRELGESL